MNKVTKRTTRKPRERKVNPDKPLLEHTEWLGLEGNNVNLEDYAGFVYLITNLKSGRKYIGRKYLWAHTRVKVANRKNRKRKVSESNWRHYKSSCDELKEDIKRLGSDCFRFEIMWLCKTRKETNYKELEEQVKRDVLFKKLPSGEFEYYNGNILSRYFRAKENDDEQ